MPVAAQNTKGDQPVRAPRETRIRQKTPAVQKQKKVSKRISPSRRTPAMQSHKGTQPAKVVRPLYSGRPSEERAWKGNAAGNRVSVRTATAQTRNIYPQRGRFVHNPSIRPDRSQEKWQAVKSKRVTVRSATGRIKNVYPQTGRYVHNPSRKPDQPGRRIESNQSIIARNLSSPSRDEPPRRKKRVVPATASRPFIQRRSINPYAGFWNRKQKGEKAYVGDIAGRRLRTKNYVSPRPPVSKPTTTPYYGRKGMGDRPYKGPAAGGYISATRPGRAWQGDIAGRKVRGRNFSSKAKIEQSGQPIHPPRLARQRPGDRPYRGTMPGGGYKTATRPGEKKIQTSPLPPRAPGIGARRIDTWSGNIKGRKIFADQGIGFAGMTKARKPLKGGGSVSGRLWNNRGQPIPGKTPGLGARRVDTYSGNIRGRKVFGDQGEGYAGAIKTKKPRKGGGSISGRLWNNNQQPVQGKTPVELPGNFPGKHRLFDLKPSLQDQGEEYTGALKTRRPKKGGESISGKLWNNNGQPIPVRTPDESAAKAARYSGNIKAGRKEPHKSVGGFPGKYHEFDLHPDMRNQGEEFTGYVRLSRFKRNYLKNPNQAEEAIKKQRPDKNTYEVRGLQVRVKRQPYVENENATDESLKKLKPSKFNQQVSGLQVKVREGNYHTKPHAADEALKGIAPSRASVKASEFSKALKREWDYHHNPASAKEALDVREPGKAFGRATDYQGNIRMKKFELFDKRELHPDAQFVKTNKNNVKEEKDLLTSVKLWWGKMFRKTETQPVHLKEKIRKPRFDKREIGLWYD